MPQPESSRLPEAAPAAGGRIFERFELIRKLGQGGMGQVWLARDEMLVREVALKFLPDMLVHDPAALEDLRAETRHALRLTHEGIVRTYDFYCAEQMACIAMEYVNGGTLSQLRLKEPRRVFEPEQILPWIEQACVALHYAHSVAKVAHRDLKPSNIMIDETGRVKLTDFGIARSLSDSVSRVSNRPNSSGTLPYMSPQQLYGEKPSALDDVYAMGATIHELVTGKPPFYSGCLERQIIDRIPPTMAERRVELDIEGGTTIPPNWERVVAACLSKSREERPQTMLEVARALGNHAWVEQRLVAPTSQVDPGSWSVSPPKAVVAPGSVPPLPMLRPAFDSGVAQSPPSSAVYAAGHPSSRILWILVASAFLLGMFGLAGGVWIVLKAREKSVPIARLDEDKAPPSPRAEEAQPAIPFQPERIPGPERIPTPDPESRPPVVSQRNAAMPVAGSTCQGFFTYHDPERRHRTAFTFVFAEVSAPDPTGSAKIAGVMNEQRIDFGPPGVKTLSSSFSGTWTPTANGARIAFTKIYRFDGHPTEYVGAYDATTQTVTGTWDLNGYSGDFTLTGVVTQ